MSGKNKQWKMSKSLQFTLLILLFLVPPTAAYILFYSDFRPSLTGNYGELIQPARPVKDVDLQTVDGEFLRFSDLHSKWTLLYLGAAKCDAVCSENLYKIHQIRLAQGKNMERVRSVYIVPADVSRSDIEKIKKRYPGIRVLLAQSGAYLNLINQFQAGEGTVSTPVQRIYLVDPIGNAMMSYHAQADPSGIRKDLKKLLKVSQIG